MERLISAGNRNLIIPRIMPMGKMLPCADSRSETVQARASVAVGSVQGRQADPLSKLRKGLTSCQFGLASLFFSIRVTGYQASERQSNHMHVFTFHFDERPCIRNRSILGFSTNGLGCRQSLATLLIIRIRDGLLVHPSTMPHPTIPYPWSPAAWDVSRGSYLGNCSNFKPNRAASRKCHSVSFTVVVYTC